MKHCLIQLQKIQAQVSRKCIKKVCQDGQCSLSLQELDPAQFLLLSMDGPGAPVQRSETRCDFLFFGCFSQCDLTWVSPVELTASTNKSATKIVEQLRAGAMLADRLVSSDLNIRFTPIAACPFRKHHRQEFRKESNAIEFRGCAILPTVVNCDSKLVAALDMDIEH